jgi:hypothetical protein
MDEQEMAGRGWAKAGETGWFDLDVWACMDCGHKQRENGNCARCNKEPLVDLRKPNVREMLFETEDDLRSQRDKRVRILSVGLLFAFPLAMLPGVRQVPFGWFGAAIGSTVLFMQALPRLFPYRRRFPYLRR